jgi:hypothetical protein
MSTMADSFLLSLSSDGTVYHQVSCSRLGMDEALTCRGWLGQGVLTVYWLQNSTIWERLMFPFGVMATRCLTQIAAVVNQGLLASVRG